MYFHYVAIISYLKNACPFIWRNFDSLYSRILRAKLSWNSNSNDSNDYVKNVFKKYIRTVFIGHTFFALSLSLLTFFFICACKSYFKVCRYKNYVNYSIIWHPFLLLVRLSHMCHWMSHIKGQTLPCGYHCLNDSIVHVTNIRGPSTYIRSNNWWP